MGKTVMNHGCGVEIEEAKQMMKGFITSGLRGSGDRVATMPAVY